MKPNHNEKQDFTALVTVDFYLVNQDEIFYTPR